jgi:flagellar biosynthesis GTPase FlhF
MWIISATHIKTGVEISQLKVTSTLETNTMTEQTWVATKALWHKAANKSSRTRSKYNMIDALHKRRTNQAAQKARYRIERLWYMQRDQESTRAIHILSKHKESVWECSHISEDVTICRIKRHEQAYGEPSVSQSLQAKDWDHQSSCSPFQSLHLTCEKRERGVQVLNSKGLVGEYLRTQDVDTIQMYSTYHEGEQDAKLSS